MAPIMLAPVVLAFVRLPPLALQPVPSKALVLRGGAIDAGIGSAYAAALASHPILTKSLTAGTIFSLSDVSGQTIAPSPDGFDLKRTITSALVGLLYFGPALHFWLEMITKIIPGFGVGSTLCKTLLGQCFFGPAITAVFFGSSLVSVEGLASGLSKLPAKIKQDLVKTWAAGLCYWPFVDLLFYSLLPVKWIPLGYNMASFLWTIFLSLQAAKTV